MCLVTSVNLGDPSGLCVLGIPCPKPIKKAASFVKRNAAEVVQFADVLPLREARLVGGFAVGDVAGAAIGYIACDYIETQIGRLAQGATHWQIEESQCSAATKSALYALNRLNADVDRELGTPGLLRPNPPLARALTEVGLYGAHYAVLKSCQDSQLGKE